MSEEDNMVKVILVGNSGVGKTCIIRRFIQGDFDQFQSITIGSEHFSKILDVDGQRISVNVWDTSGQEIYAKINNIFFKGAEIAILVYDITRVDSFEKMKTDWYQQVKDVCEEDIVLGVAGSKCDLIADEQVSEEQAKAFANEIGAIYGLTSALSGDGVDELFNKLVKKYASNVASQQDDDNQGGGEPKPQQQQNIKLSSIKANEPKPSGGGCCKK